MYLFLSLVASFSPNVPSLVDGNTTARFFLIEEVSCILRKDRCDMHTFMSCVQVFWRSAGRRLRLNEQWAEEVRKECNMEPPDRPEKGD